MEPFSLALVCILAALLAVNLGMLLRSRATDLRQTTELKASLARIDTRLDEQSRWQVEHSQTLRSEIEQNLTAGLARADRTHAEIIRRFALIDRAQQRITELSSNVVSLREILADRSARGAFGEVQLRALVSNVLPPSGYKLQHTLSNGRRVDCMLILPAPTGNVAIDSKFPFSNFRRKIDRSLPRSERERAGRAFARDVRTHIDDVASKYIVPGETCDGAVMFIPAESVFAEIHAECPELVERAQRRNVWLTSPTTLIAVLTTTRSVLRDAATRREVHAIQLHLRALGKEFTRFEKNMDRLASHVRLAGEDVTRIRISSRRISDRFRMIDQLDLDTDPEPPREYDGCREATAGTQARPGTPDRDSAQLPT